MFLLKCITVALPCQIMSYRNFETKMNRMLFAESTYETETKQRHIKINDNKCEQKPLRFVYYYDDDNSDYHNDKHFDMLVTPCRFCTPIQRMLGDNEKIN